MICETREKRYAGFSQPLSRLNQNTAEAHLGLAFANLQLHHPKPALTQLDAAQKILGNSHAWHLARAEAFRQEQDFPHAATEYRQRSLKIRTISRLNWLMPTCSTACGDTTMQRWL